MGCHGGSNLHWDLPAQCSGEWCRLKRVPSQGGHTAMDPAEALSTTGAQDPSSNLIPPSVHDLSILQARDRPQLSQRRTSPPLRPSQWCCSPVPEGSLQGSHHPLIPMGLQEETAELTSNPAIPMDTVSTEGCSLLPPAPKHGIEIPLTQLIFPLLPLRRC